MDYDSTQVPVLADIECQGRPRKVMMWANRNGLFYVLDRTTGQFLLGKPFVKVNWLTGFDEKGRPMRAPGQQDSPTPVLIQPNVLGGTNWYPPSYSPHTGLFYIPGWENSGTMVAKGARIRPRHRQHAHGAAQSRGRISRRLRKASASSAPSIRRRAT